MPIINEYFWQNKRTTILKWKTSTFFSYWGITFLNSKEKTCLNIALSVTTKKKSKTKKKWTQRKLQVKSVNTTTIVIKTVIISITIDFVIIRTTTQQQQKKAKKKEKRRKDMSTHLSSYFPSMDNNNGMEMQVTSLKNHFHFCCCVSVCLCACLCCTVNLFVYVCLRKIILKCHKQGFLCKISLNFSVFASFFLYEIIWNSRSVAVSYWQQWTWNIMWYF